SGSGQVVKQSFPSSTSNTQGQVGSTQVLQGANTYTGPTQVLSGRLVLSGPVGAITSSSSITIAGGGLVLNNDSVGNLPGPPIPRITPTAPISLAGELAAIGNQTIDTPVSVGAVTLTGGATFTVTPGLAATASLNADSLTRTNRATVLFRGTNLGA